MPVNSTGTYGVIDVNLFAVFLPLAGGTLTGPLTIPVGAAATPSLNFAGNTTTGVFQRTSGVFSLTINGAQRFELGDTGMRVGSGVAIGWSPGGQPTAGQDTALSRIAAGVTGVGTGAQGSIAGTLRAALVQLGSSTAPVAGGSAAAGLQITSSSVGVYVSNGVPTFSAAQGSLCMNTAGSGIADRLYVNTNGTTGWTPFASAT